MAHKPKLAFVEDHSYERLAEPKGWTYTVEGSYYTVEGPCPRCGAERQIGQVVDEGPVSVDSDTVAEFDPLDRFDGDDRVEVPVQCSCGPTHGKDKTGCGAKFFVRIGDLR